jgi:hypothetical protein
MSPLAVWCDQNDLRRPLNLFGVGGVDELDFELVIHSGTGGGRASR